MSELVSTVCLSLRVSVCELGLVCILDFFRASEFLHVCLDFLRANAVCFFACLNILVCVCVCVNGAMSEISLGM